MDRKTDESLLRLALPKGRMQDGVFQLLADAGIRMQSSGRDYRPVLAFPGTDTKLLKPQNIIEMLQAGSRDVGFAGADWAEELGARVVELLDTELDPVRVVAAAPEALLEDGRLPRRPLVVASEYARLSAAWIHRIGIDATFVRSYGATEVFPPEDADLIVDNTATGSTLRANGLRIVDEILQSSTRLYASAEALDDREKRASIERLVMLVRSVLDARQRVMIEVNVTTAQLEAVVAAMPCMRQPTIASLRGGDGYAVKAAVPRAALPVLIPELKACGATDVVVTALSQLVP